MRQSIRVGLLGCGTVGSAVVRALTRDPRLRERFEIVAIAVARPEQTRAVALPVTPAADALAVAADPRVDVVVEAIGGLGDARDAVLAALQRSVPVVTANKALVGTWGPELRALAVRHGVAFRYEAAVAAAVPLIRILEAIATSDRITRVQAVLNGTSNFVLHEMAAEGVDLETAVKRAQVAGYAEADPARDIDGTDAADKLAIIAQVVWGSSATTVHVQRCGIGHLDVADVERARGRGLVWRLVASATADGGLGVGPRLLPAADPLARLTGADNGVVLDCERAGRLTFTGPGAGGDATAAAILADLVSVQADR